ncbi:hypothetical protein C4552_02970 [Candidatus Parcubacteria bacterium]|nr:MAG: hypothetical protein C4552_02970 [Candidatus Parcubacteria bacterium]
MLGIGFRNYRTLGIVTLVAAAAVIAAVVWRYYGKMPGAADGPADAPIDVGMATGTPMIDGETPNYLGVAVATLNADPDFLKQVPPETDAKLRAELADIAHQLEKDPRVPALWMRVAYIKHFYNDDAGARDAYEYLNIISPSDGLPFYNLALLYGYYLKEPAKAEAKFQAAIDRDPNHAAYYYGFGAFYREVVHNPGRAEEVLLAGLRVASEDAGLVGGLASLYEEQREYAKAKKYYETLLGLTDLSDAERAAARAALERIAKKQGN